MPAKSISYYLSPTLLLLSTALAAANWYVQPGRAGAPAVALLLVACMTAALFRNPGHKDGEAARRQEEDSIRTGIAFAGSILVLSLGMKLVSALGGAADVELSWRAVMAIIGAFFVFTGNALPKKLWQLSAVPENAARVQAFQRFAGWTWVLTGLAFALAWLLLPVNQAEPLTFILIPGAVLIIGVQMIRLRRACGRAA